MPVALEQAFLDSYEQFGDAIYRHCFYRIHSKEKAEDLVQEAYTRTWKYMAVNGAPDNMRAFLYRVANNLVIDEVRKTRPTTDIDYLSSIGQEPGKDLRERLVDFLDGQEAIEKMKELSHEDRQVLTMRYVDGLKPKEIAHIINETQNVVSVRITRAKKRLATLLI